MTVGGMQVAWWLEWVLAVLAACGALSAGWVAAAGLQAARDWWQARRYRKRRGQPPGISDDCWFGTHEDCDGCDCAGCGHSGPPDPLLELPPERTWEQMTSHQLPVGLPEVYEAMVPGPLERELWHDVERERRAPWWEAEHRAAYESLNLDYPSGLLSRIREYPVN